MILYIRLGSDDFFHLALHVAGTMCQPVCGLSDLRLPIKLPKSQIQPPSSHLCPLSYCMKLHHASRASYEIPLSRTAKLSISNDE